MARNSEKRLCRLNRFLEAKASEERDSGDNSTTAKLRPPLYKLTTAQDVKKWIPSIQREIDYCLQQLEGVGSRKYTDIKLDEFREKVELLEREHKRFVSKVRSLDPTHTDIPWKPRAYTRKRPRGPTSSSPAKQLHSPLTDKSLTTHDISHIATTPPVTSHVPATTVTVTRSTHDHHSNAQHSELQATPTTHGLLGLSYSSSSEED